MPSGELSPGELRDRVEELAGDNRWRQVHDLLADHDRERVLRDHLVAYRFGQSLYYTGRIEELSRFADRFEAATRDSSAPDALMRALNLAGTTAFELGDIEKARRCFDRLMEFAEAEDDTEMQARAANNLGAVAALSGRVDESLSYYRLAAPLYERMGRPRGLAEMRHNMAIAYRDLGRLDDATESYRKAADLADSVGHTSLVVLATVGRAETELRNGDETLAGELIRRGLADAREIGDPLSEADALRVRGLVRAAEPERREEALEDFRQARALADSAGNRFLRGEIDRDRARTLLDAGRPHEARDAGRDALDTFRSMGASHEAGRVRDLIDGLAPGAS